MAAQSHQFLIYAYLICEDRHLGQKSSFIYSSIAQQFLHTVFQLLTVFSNDLGRTFRNEIHQLQHAIQLAN